MIGDCCEENATKPNSIVATAAYEPVRRLVSALLRPFDRTLTIVDRAIESYYCTTYAFDMCLCF